MTLNILNTAVGMILLMAIGFLCSKVGIIDQGTEKKLTALLLKVVQPVYIFVAYQRAFDRELLGNHIRTCVADDIRAGHDEVIDELLDTLQRMMK